MTYSPLKSCKEYYHNCIFSDRFPRMLDMDIVLRNLFQCNQCGILQHVQLLYFNSKYNVVVKKICIVFLSKTLLLQLSLVFKKILHCIAFFFYLYLYKKLYILVQFCRDSFHLKPTQHFANLYCIIKIFTRVNILFS